MVIVTESMVDAKDKERQAEVRNDLSEALRGVEGAIFRQTKWLAGLLVGLAGVVVGGLAAAVSIILSRLP